MPIRRELRHHYGEHWHTVTRPHILRMAGGIFDGETYLGGARCEACNAVDRSAVLRWRRFNSDEIAYEIKFERRAVALRVAAFHRDAALVEVQIGVAHLNNVAGDDRETNLAALCRRCHLIYDKEFHRTNRQTRKDLARPLFEQLYTEKGNTSPHDHHAPLRDSD